MSAPVPILTTVTSWPQAAGVAWRWARTYSRLRDLWRPLGLIGCPGVWAVNLLTIGRNAADIVVLGVAAAKVPNPITRPPRRLWSALLAPPIGLVLIVGVLTALSTSSMLAASMIGVAGGALLAVLGVGMAIEICWGAGGQILSGRGLHRGRARLERETGRPVVVGSMFGAWPRLTGDGGKLSADIRAELTATGVSVIGVARDDKLLAKYIGGYHARQLDPARPRIVAWLAEAPAPVEH